MLIGQSKPIQQLRVTLRKIARSQAPVFITGESGTGKEVIANLVHRLSNRNEGPFIAINCGAIPTELMESGWCFKKYAPMKRRQRDTIRLYLNV